MYSKEERETICNYDEMNDSWSIYTCVRRHITRLTKIFGEDNFAKTWRDDSGRIIAIQIDDVNPSQVSFRNKVKRKELSEEERVNLAERARRNFHNN